MITVRVDASDLNRLADHFDEAGDNTLDGARKVVSKGSLNIKTAAKATISGHAHLPHYPASITYDMVTVGMRVDSEIGPDKSLRQGPLGNIMEFGTINNAPIPHLVPAWHAETPRFVDAAEDLGERLIE